MALTITITDPKLIKMIQQKAEEAGLSPQQTIQQAFDARDASHNVIDGSRQSIAEEVRRQEILDLIRDMQSRMDPTMSRTDYDDWLYDEHGLPK
ncbi:MAG: type II toxin-antitoxin system VapB family antitoxin [Thermomicrobiales bacterium]